ncbi:MAG: arginine repressor [Ignavibacteriales bacterium]|nr:arginine repressor [Ignavibacteriales bacterium]
MSSKLTRTNRIKELILTNAIVSQEQLVKMLTDEGIEVTQATLSRDFADLGVVRVSGEQGGHYTLSQNETVSSVNKLIGYEILAVVHNESTVVVKTLAGRAQGVAYFIDKFNHPEILGTIAGDDTVLVIPAKHKYIKSIIKFIKDTLDNVKIPH